jgi:AcrR family transcriptional regulator
VVSDFRPPTEFGDSKKFRQTRRRAVPADLWPALVTKMLCVSVANREIRRHPPFFKAPIGQKILDEKKPLDKRTLSKEVARKPRTDALRNRDRLLNAARTVFSAGGPDASLEAVARKAGVGIGTLYRHFPTREALFEAVYRREVQQLANFAKRLEEEAEPVEALRQWMRSFVKFAATKKGMSAALAFAVAKDSDLVSYSSDLLTRAVGGLLSRAGTAGEIRNDITPEDLLRVLVGMCYAHDQPGWQKNVLRLVDVFIDGLRTRRTKHRTEINRKISF